MRLGSSSKVEGSILTPRIGIDDGARLRSKVEMTRSSEAQIFQVLRLETGRRPDYNAGISMHAKASREPHELDGKSRPGATGTATATKPGASAARASPNLKVRTSNGLKEFLWMLSDIPRVRVLDLGPVWQSTVNFFLEKGFRISTEDLLGTWKDFVSAEEERMRTAPLNEDGSAERVSASALAEKFLENAIQYPEESVHGVLAWDLLDYFDPAVGARIMDRLFRILHPGGAVLALFHSRAPEQFHRYRIVDTQTRRTG